MTNVAKNYSETIAAITKEKALVWVGLGVGVFLVFSYPTVSQVRQASLLLIIHKLTSQLGLTLCRWVASAKLKHLVESCGVIWHYDAL